MLGKVSFCAPRVSVILGCKLPTKWKGARSEILHSIGHGAESTTPTRRGGWVNSRGGLISCTKCLSRYTLQATGKVERCWE